MIFIGYRTSEYGFQFWDPENRKILRHKVAVFNERMVYNDLLMENTPEQQSSAIDLEFVELDDILVENIQSILEENEELHVEPLNFRLR